MRRTTAASRSVFVAGFPKEADVGTWGPSQDPPFFKFIDFQQRQKEKKKRMGGWGRKEMADDDHSNLVSYPIGSLVRTRSASKSTDLVHRIEPDFGGFRLPSKRYRLITSIRHTLPYGWGGGGVMRAVWTIPTIRSHAWP